MAQWSPYNRPRRDAVCNPEILQKGFELGAATVHGLPFESDRALNDKTEIHLIGQHTKPLSREALTKVRASFFDTEDIRITFKDPHSLKIICIEVPFEERIKNLLKIVYRLTDLMIGTELFFRGFLLIFHGTETYGERTVTDGEVHCRHYEGDRDGRRDRNDESTFAWLSKKIFRSRSMAITGNE